jgi:hypothetical protein
LRHAHLRRIHKRKRCNMCRPDHGSQSGLVERPRRQTVPARRHQAGNLF